MLYKQLERKILGTGRRVAASLALVFCLTPLLGVGTAPCYAPKAVGGWIGGSGDDVNNEIQAINVVKASGGGQVVGWFYRLADADLYFQPAITEVVSKRLGRPARTFIKSDDRVKGKTTLKVGEETILAAAAAMRRFLTTLHVRSSRVPKVFESLAGDNCELRLCCADNSRPASDIPQERAAPVPNRCLHARHRITSHQDVNASLILTADTLTLITL